MSGDLRVQWLMGKVPCLVSVHTCLNGVGGTAGGLAWLVIGRQLWSPQEVVWQSHSGRDWWEVWEIVIDVTKNVNWHDDDGN